jgi:hypothetical protein
MKVEFRYWFIGLIFILLHTVAFAQPSFGKSSGYKDYFLLKNNTFFYGKLIDYGVDTIVLELKSGARVRFLQDQIKRVRIHDMKDENDYHQVRSENLFDNPKKHYVELNTSFFSGYSRPLISGLGTHIHYKYRFIKQHAITLSTGFEALAVADDAVKIIPATLGYEYFLSRANNSPYFYARGGIGFADELEDKSWWGDTESFTRDGMRLEFGGGVQFSLGKKFGMILSSGMLIQKTGYVISNNWQQLDRSVTMRRLIFNFGFVF